jgi:hypothetical protein
MTPSPSPYPPIPKSSRRRASDAAQLSSDGAVAWRWCSWNIGIDRAPRRRCAEESAVGVAGEVEGSQWHGAYLLSRESRYFDHVVLLSLRL